MKKILPVILLAYIVLISGCSAEPVSTEVSKSTSENPVESTTSQSKPKSTVNTNSETSKEVSKNAPKNPVESTTPQIKSKSTVNNNSETSKENKLIPVSHKIENFEIIGQLPELPTGCEITAMTMVLNYYGLNPDKIQMATEYLPTTAYYTYYENDKLIGPDLDNYFLGDPTSEYGYVCGTNAIITASNAFLEDIDSNYVARDLSGCDISDLYGYVSQDKPIAVWTTIEMADRYETEGWYTESGKYVEWSQNDHCNVLIGYSEETVTIADPLLGIVEYDKEQFEKVLASRGSKAVALF